MQRARRNRAGIAGLLVAALSLVAMLALTGTAAAKHGDRNGDRIPDRWEKHHHLSLKVDQGRLDQDRDHLGNRAEFLAGDNPRDRDSDDDGVMDGNENAGTIASFDATSGRLVIDLFGNETIAGTVTPQTEIKCENEHEHAEGHEAGDDNGNEGEAGCTAADLKAGAVVQEAELELEHGQATFEEVELAG